MGYLEKVSYVIEGETCVSIDHIAEKVGIDAEELAHVYKKYGDMYFAIDYINRNKHRNSLKNHAGKYVLDGKKFDNISDVAKHLGVLVSRLSRLSKGCTTWEQVMRKLDASNGRVTYVLDGVSYTSLEKVASAYGVCKTRLSREHNKYKDIEWALSKVLTYPYKQHHLKSHLKNKEYLQTLFVKKANYFYSE